MPELIQALLSHGANLNSQDKDGWTPFALAIRRGNTNNALALVQHVLGGQDQTIDLTQARQTYDHQKGFFRNFCNANLIRELDHELGDNYQAVSVYQLTRKLCNMVHKGTISKAPMLEQDGSKKAREQALTQILNQVSECLQHHHLENMSNAAQFQPGTQISI